MRMENICNDINTGLSVIIGHAKHNRTTLIHEIIKSNFLTEIYWLSENNVFLPKVSNITYSNITNLQLLIQALSHIKDKIVVIDNFNRFLKDNELEIHLKSIHKLGLNNNLSIILNVDTPRLEPKLPLNIVNMPNLVVGINTEYILSDLEQITLSVLKNRYGNNYSVVIFYHNNTFYTKIPIKYHILGFMKKCRNYIYNKIKK